MFTFSELCELIKLVSDTRIGGIEVDRGRISGRQLGLGQQAVQRVFIPRDAAPVR